LALMGDNIDNIPGVPGVGEKTARDLLQQFGSLEALLERSAEVAKSKLRESLRTYAEQARLSKRLASIRMDLPVPWAVTDLTRKAPDVTGLLDLFRELEFSRLVHHFSQPDLA